YHLRLEPETELHAHGLNFFGNSGDAARKPVCICHPVTQAGVVTAALSEPAVVEDKQFDAALLCGSGYGEKLFLCEIKIRCLPVVDQDRTGTVSPVAARQTSAVEIVESLAHIVQAAVRIYD